MMTSQSSANPPTDPPAVILDKNGGHIYERGNFLGKGGFARCYEFVDRQTRAVYAGKVVPKSMLKSESQKQKMVQEVRIQRSLSHPHIVKLVESFEDNDNVYVVMELCRRRSLMELHRRRKSLSEPEVRYYTRQILEACQYLHNKKVIHRDLKLGNIFLNDSLQIKVGDFGLATQVEFDSERKKTMCGTPNYIAPEILNKGGHSYEVDVWSVGCVVYTLLVGAPPFETKSLRETYRKIRKGEYYVPDYVSPEARSFIGRMLSLEPSARPSMKDAMMDPWLTMFFIPVGLPVSALTTQPRFEGHMNEIARFLPGVVDPMTSRKPMTELNPQEERAISSGGAMASLKSTGGTAVGGALNSAAVYGNQENTERESIESLYRQMVFLLDKRNPTLTARNAGLSEMADLQDPASSPVYWVSKWVDYSDKYGLGYQLCDNSVGVLFNDHSRMLMTTDEAHVQFISAEGVEHRFPTSSLPNSELEKKMRLMRHFRGYMEEYLLMAGENQVRAEVDAMVRLPYMSSWFRTQNAIVMHLSNGTLQINIFQDHTKLILCPLMSAATYIDKARNFTTYRFDQMQANGIAPELEERLVYAKLMIEQMIRAKLQQQPPHAPPPTNNAAVAAVDRRF